MNGSETDRGVIPRAVEDVFAKIETVECNSIVLEELFLNLKRYVHILALLMACLFVWFQQFGYQMSDREFLIRVSYMEIYNEEINDLLDVENQKLQIHESLEVGFVPLNFLFLLWLM